MMIKNLFFLSLLLLCKCSFKSNGDDNKKTTYTAKFVRQNEFDITLAGKIDSYVGIHPFWIDTVCHILYLNDAKQLVISDLKNNATALIDFSKYIKRLKLYSASVSEDTFYFFNQDSAIIYGFQISTQKELIEKIKIRLSKNYNTYDPVWYDKNKNENKPFLNFQYSNTFRVNSPFVYLSYGIYDRKNHSRDKYAYIKLDLSDTTLPAQKLFPQPAVFRSGKYYTPNTFLNFFPDGSCVYSFESYDSIYKFNSRDEMVSSKILNSNDNFRFFKRERTRDLGYVGIYTETNERNILMITGGKNEVLIIKKPAKEKLADANEFDLYILDSALNIKYKDKLPDSVLPYGAIPFQNGFLLFNSNMTKVYYYEVL